MTLLEEIHAKCSAELIASRDYDAMAAAVNVGRTRPNAQEIGNGAVLEVLGLDQGNAFLDMISTAGPFRHVKSLLEQGRLRISSALVHATLQSMVPAVLSAEQVSAFLALGVDADPVSGSRIANALDGGE